MRIVITGASGNIGTALLRRLTTHAAADGAHQLVGVSRRRPASETPYDRAEWASIDLSADDAAARLETVFAGADAVVHLAWMLQPSHERDLMRRTNQGGTRAVAQAARAAGVKHLVHVSSLGAYAASPRGAWADESWPTTGVPTSPYSVDKAAAERIVASRSEAAPDESGGYALSVVRPALVLQPDAAGEIARYFLGPLIPASLVRPGLMRLAPWPRELNLQLVHADDVADALARIVERRAYGAFNLAAGPVIDRARIRETFGGIGPAAPLRVLRAAADLTWRLHLQPTDAGWLDLGGAVPLMTTTRAREVLGWQPQHHADELLRTFLVAMGRRRGANGPLLAPRGH